MFPDTSNTSSVNSMNLGEIFAVNFDVNFNDSDLDFGTNINNFNSENMGNFNLGNMENFNFGNMDIDTVKFDNLGADTSFNPEQPFIFPPQPSYFNADMVLPVEPSTNHSSSASTSNTSCYVFLYNYTFISPFPYHFT